MQIEEEVSSEELLHLAMEMYGLTEVEVRRPGCVFGPTSLRCSKAEPNRFAGLLRQYMASSMRTNCFGK